MRNHRFLGTALAILMAAGIHAHAATSCTAANPNTTSVVEATPTSSFVNNNDGTVTHALTGLMWKRCSQGASGPDCAAGAPATMSWQSALGAALADTTAGHGDWRVPNKKELESIIEFCGFSPAINQTIFPATIASTYWSSTTYAPDPATAFDVNFATGEAEPYGKQYGHYVRLVRGGNEFAYFDANRPAVMDIDGDGTADALTDGLLMLRYLFGLRGPGLIQNAIAPGALRKTAAEIESFIGSILP